jgi:hypothetical protein
MGSRRKSQRILERDFGFEVFQGRIGFDDSTNRKIRIKDERKEKPTPEKEGVGFRVLSSVAELNLKHVPEELVVDLVMVLDFGGFDEGAKVAGAAVGGGFFEIGVAILYV